MKSNLSDSKLVLDPDLIDLTMIPPPMTPDEEGPARMFPGTVSAVSTPPTPFADRQSLEAELKVTQFSLCEMMHDPQALERDLGGLSERGWEGGAVYGGGRRDQGPVWPECDDDEKSSLPGLSVPEQEESESWKELAALRHLRADDIDMFIAHMAVPPPPSVIRQQVGLSGKLYCAV